MVDTVVILDGVAPLNTRGVHDMQDDLRALDMAQKLMTESRAVRSALDQAGNIRHHEILLLVHSHDAQYRRNRREMVLGNLRPRRRDA